MNGFRRHLVEWPAWVGSYVLAYLMVFSGSALSLYLWAAPLGDWGPIFRQLFRQSFVAAIPFGLILGFAWHRARSRRSP